MDIETVTADILTWCETFVEVPHPSLGGWPPCPFARQARLNQTIQVLTGADPYFDLKNRASWGMGQYEVVVYGPHVFMYFCSSRKNSSHYSFRTIK